MKRTLFLACIVSLLSASLLNASTPGNRDYTSVIRDFIDSHMTTDVKKFKDIMDDRATLKIPRGEKVLVQGKDDLVSSMKGEAGTQQNCTSAYEVLAKSDALVIARVDFNYENTIQHHYLIIEKNANMDWKITQVCKMFDDIKMPENGNNSIAARN